MHPRGSFESNIERLKQDDPTLTSFSLGFWSSAWDHSKISVLAAALKGNTQLKSLDLSWVAIGRLAFDLASGLAENKGLQELDLRHAQIDSWGLFLITKALSESETVTSLYLHYRQDSHGYLTTNVDLTAIMDMCVELGADFDEHLKLFADDNGSNLGSSFGHSFIILVLSAVELLDISHTELTDLDMAYLSLSLIENNVLKRLIIDGKRPAHQIKMLATALKHNSTLERLVIQPADSEGVSYIADMLNHNDSLTSLLLDVNKLTENDIHVLRDALKNNKTLTRLDTNTIELFNKSLLFNEYLIRNHISRFNDAITAVEFENKAGEGVLLESELTKIQAAADYFIKYARADTLITQLPILLDALKNLLAGKSVKLNLFRLLTCDKRIRSAFLHIYAKQLMIQGNFLLAITLFDQDRMMYKRGAKDCFRLIDAMLCDDRLHSSEEVLTFDQQFHIGCALLRDIFYLIDSDDAKLMLRRLITFYKRKKHHERETLLPIEVLTGANHILTLDELGAVLSVLQARSANEAFKKLEVKNIVGERDFQSLIEKMKAEMAQLPEDKRKLPETFSYFESETVFRCYESIVLSPDAGTDIQAIIREQTRALRNNELTGTIASRYMATEASVVMALLDLRGITLQSLLGALAIIIDRGVDEYFSQSTSKKSDNAFRMLEAFENKDFNAIATLMKDRNDHVLCETIEKELILDDLAHQVVDKEWSEHIIADAVKGIDYYLTLDRKSLFKSHLNMFAIVFDNDRGVLRANAYKRVLADPARDFNDKLIVLYGLLKSHDGKKLQECVKNHIGLGDQVTERLAGYLQTQAVGIDVDAVSKEVFRVANAKPDESIDLGLIATRRYMTSSP